SELHRGVNYFLNQEKFTNRDGMDIAICKIDKKSKKLYFSGAMNSLYLVKDKELIEFKGTRKYIGGSNLEETRAFQEEEISLDSPTKIYLSSDGYMHQFGGSDHKKFS